MAMSDSYDRTVGVKVCVLLVTILTTLLSASHALWCETGELNLSVYPNVGYTDTNFRIEYQLNVSKSIGNFSSTKSNMSFYLMPIDFNESYFPLNFSYDNFLRKFEVNLTQNGSFTFTWDRPGVYEIYASVKADNTYVPCNYEKSILVHGKETEIVYKEKEYEDLYYKVEGIPDEIYLNEPFVITVNITNVRVDGDIQVYSYIYDGLDVLSESWTHNKKTINLERDSSAVVHLTERAVRGEPGRYKLKVRIRTDDKDYDYVQYITLKRREIGNLTIVKNSIENNTLVFSAANFNTHNINYTFLVINDSINVYNGTLDSMHSFIYRVPFNTTVRYFLFENGSLVYFNSFEMAQNITNITKINLMPQEDKQEQTDNKTLYSVISITALAVLLTLLKFV